MTGPAADASRNIARRATGIEQRARASAFRVIEIDLIDGARLRVDAFVNERAIRGVLAVLKAAFVIQIAPGTKVYLACGR